MQNISNLPNCETAFRSRYAAKKLDASSWFQWFCMIFYDFSMIFHDFPWLFMTFHDFLWLLWQECHLRPNCTGPPLEWCSRMGLTWDDRNGWRLKMAIENGGFSHSKMVDLSSSLCEKLIEITRNCQLLFLSSLFNLGRSRSLVSRVSLVSHWCLELAPSRTPLGIISGI